MNTIYEDAWIWINHEKEMYLPVKVMATFSKGEKARVLTEEGDVIKLDESKTVIINDCNVEALSPHIVDLVNISDLNEMSILHNLRIRYKQDYIYTKISSILISVNPFKLLPLYTPEMLDKYRNNVGDVLPPHIFSVAYDAYHGMFLSEQGNQSVVISGESGAGKSEATKLILQFLTDVSTRTNAATTGLTLSSRNSLEQQILAANPILEAFGNAKTLRNNNSSRFGKLITVNFDNKGCIVGGCIINYLLEKSRVVFQSAGERNYHIFYQLLTATSTDEALTSELRLQKPELFEYTSQSGITSVDGISDEKDFEDVQNAMNILQFPMEDQHEILKIVAGVLHFGNLKFRVVKHATAEDAACIANMEVLEHASYLWGISDVASMAKYLCAKNIGTKEVLLVTYNVKQAQDSRDAMVKRVYSEIFQIIVNKINKVLSAHSNTSNKFIGVLDIFGFESFDVNSFEQLCINYCNEKLQFHFNEHIFKMEQALYADEGITIPGTAFVDNQPTLDLLELRNVGVFSMVDEEINVPRGSDEGFLQKLFVKFADGKHPNLIRPKAKECKDFLKNFGIIHYAGSVFYNVTNFLEKNKGQLHLDIICVLRESSSTMMKGIFAVKEDDKKVAVERGKSNKPVTLGAQFKSQLNDLIATINGTYPHFVRCMKPNDSKSGNLFNSSRMLDQLRYAGLVEVCRIRKLGFPVRRLFEEFYKRYRCCDISCSDLNSLLTSLVNKQVLSEGEWARGNTRIFMRNMQATKLEIERDAKFTLVVVATQRIARGYVNRQRMKNFVAIIDRIRRAIEVRELEEVVRSVDMAFELPWRGSHLALVKTAKLLLIRIQEEMRMVVLLESAILSRNLNSLNDAIAASLCMSPPYHPDALTAAMRIVERLEAEIDCVTRLTAAISIREYDGLLVAIQLASSLDFECIELHQAQTLRLLLEEERDLISSLSQAVSDCNLADITLFISKCFDMGIDSRSEVSRAITVKDNLLAKQAEADRLAEELRLKLEMEVLMAKRAAMKQEAKDSLVASIATTDRDIISNQLQNALRCGLDGDEIALAEMHLHLMQKVSDAASKIAAGIKLLQFKSASHHLEVADLSPLKEAISDAEALNTPLTKHLSLSESIRGIPGQPVHPLTQQLANAASEGEHAVKLFDRYIQIDIDLVKYLESRNRVGLKTACESAENLHIENGLVVKARDMIKELEVTYREEKATGKIVEDIEPYDAAEESRKIRREISRQVRFDHRNYPNLCTPDDFAKGIILNKSKFKEHFLLFQSSVIPRSMTELNNEFNKLAIQLNKSLLGYMGDRQMPFPAMLAQDILRKGWEYKPIRDEIYVQIIKQLTNNPRSESVAKGWQMLCMCVGTFAPSYEFENFLIHYILEKIEQGKGAVVDYAKYCIRTLEAVLNNGDGSGFVPSVEEILAFKERPPILATIYLVDGNIITENLPITPDLNVGKVLEMCAGWLDLRDRRSTSLGMFVYDQGTIVDGSLLEKSPCDDLPRTPRPLRNEDFMGDAVVQKARQKRGLKFVVKKKIFLSKDNYRGDDAYYERLVYLQAEDDAIVQSSLQFDSAEVVARLAAISMSVAYGDDLLSIVDDDDRVCEFIPDDWRQKMNKSEWRKFIFDNNNVDTLMIVHSADLQSEFVQIVQQCPLYGNHWFYVHKYSAATSSHFMSEFPNDMILAFNELGMFVYDRQKLFVRSFAYAVINRWGGTNDQFSMLITNDDDDEEDETTHDFIITTAQAPDIAAILIDYIYTLLESFEGVE